MNKVADNKKKVKHGNLGILVACTAVVGGMVGAAYAAVPLYKLFCQVTGYGGTVSRSEQYSSRVLDKTIKVRFDANVAPGLDWDFKPEQREVEIRIGETAQIAYFAHNNTNRTIRGQATYNVTPQAAGYYFNKVECFCFTETELKPGESLDMPVVFYVDPEIVDSEDTKDFTTLTLSYTFYALDDDKPVAQVNSDEEQKAGKL